MPDSGNLPLYNILDAVGVRSDIPLRELEGFRTVAIDREDVVVTGSRDNTFYPRFDRRVLRDSQATSYVEHLGSLGATVRIISGNPIRVEVNWLLKYSSAVLYVNVVEPLLRLILAGKGFALLHGACLSRKGKAVLISAPPDTGKTTTVLRCLDKALFSFLSDDMTVIDGDLGVHKFPKPFTISAHTYESMISDVKNIKGISKNQRLRVKSLIHSRTGRRILRLIGRLNLPILTFNAVGQVIVKPPKVFVEDLVKGVTTVSQAHPIVICVLRLGGGERVQDAPPEAVLEELLFNSEDAFGFPPYSEIFHNLKLHGRCSDEILADEKALLKRLVASAKCFYLWSDSRRWDRLVNVVMDRIIGPPFAAIQPTPPEVIISHEVNVGL